ncbi:MAG: serine hydrolase domain-containing protein [Pseudomonadota bacterium]
MTTSDHHESRNGDARIAQRQLHTHWIASSGRQGGDAAKGACFPYWSFSKTAIAICALKLVEMRALDLDAPVMGERFTLRHLLAHTSGLPDYGPLKDYHAAVARHDTPWTRERLLEAALAPGMLFAPGEGWYYSNIGYLFARERIEAAMQKPLGDVIAALICEPLGLSSVRFWGSMQQSADLHWDAAASYDPRWVYHGCLIGSAQDAARILHALCTGDLLRPETRAEMLERYPVGGAIPGRPWTLCGYGLGLMSGAMSGVGDAIGHSGAGPFSVNAVYHFPDLPDPVTVACFTDGSDESPAEFAAKEIARDR